MKKFLGLLLLLAISINLLGCQPNLVHLTKNPSANNGVLDLKTYDFHGDEDVYLNGQWEFYWQELLTPQDFAGNPNRPIPGYIIVPRSWNGYNAQGNLVGGYGFATYRLKVLVKDTNQLLAIRIPAIRSAYKLWINGDLLSSNGEVGRSAREMTPQYLPQIVFFKPTNNEAQIVLQVSNFMHRRGGIWQALELGSAEHIREERDRKLALEMFLLGCLLIMGIYYIWFFSFRRQDYSALFFGLFCIILGLRVLLVGEIFLVELFPSFNWEIAMKIEYLTFYIGLPVIIKFFYNLFPQEISKRVSNLCLALGLAFSALVLFTPAGIYTYSAIYFQIIVSLFTVYTIIALFIAVYRHRDSIMPIIFGGLIFVATIFNDILYYNEVINTGNLSPLGFLTFIFAQSFTLSRRFSLAFAREEFLNQQLNELNRNLEEKVRERTIALEMSNQQLQKMNEELFRLEKSRLDLITNISHDLRTPMTSIQGYIEAILDGVVASQEQEKYLKLINNKIFRLNQMTQELFELSQLETRRIKLNYGQMPISRLIRQIYENYKLDVEATGLNFELEDSSITTINNDSVFVVVDIDRIDRVFSNLIFNAIKHTRPGNTISIGCDIVRRPADGQISISSEAEAQSDLIEFGLTKIPDRELMLLVRDNGFGVAEEDLPYIFDRYYMGSKSRTNKSAFEGAGLGLAITREIVEIHGGRIWVESEINQGSTFYFILPIYQAD